jgi:type III pantothenate kinase
MLAIDCGNTRLKWARFDGRQRGDVARASLIGDGDPFASLAAALTRDIDRVVVANVAGTATAERIVATVESNLGLAPHFVAVEANAHGIECGYRDVSTFGVDRWLGMIAVRSSVDGPFAVVSAGTAVTFDAVDRGGRHLGGLILPGERLMAEALAGNTGRIPRVEPLAGTLGPGLELLGRSTGEAVGSGTRLAVVAAIDRAARTVSSSLNETLPLFVTGGDAETLAESLSSGTEVRADLVLDGLVRVADATG